MASIVHFEALNIVGWYPTGTLNREKTVAYYQQLASIEGSHSIHRFCDFSGIDTFVMDFVNMDSLVKYRSAALPDHTAIKIGMYCPDEMGFAFCRMFEELMRGRGADILVSRELGEVAAFLSVRSEELIRDGDGPDSV